MKATPTDFRDAFRFLEEPAPFPLNLFERKPPEALPGDRKLLEDASVTLTEQGVLSQAAGLVPRKK